MPDDDTAPRISPHVRPLNPRTRAYLLTADDATDPAPSLEDFFPEVPISDPADLDFERSRRRFTQGA